MRHRREAGPGRRGLRSFRPPRSLAALLGVVTIVGLAWALLVPPWQSPDEPSHYAYAESLATGPRLPGTAGRSPISTDQGQADAASRGSAATFYLQAAPPNWSRPDYEAYLRAERAERWSRSNGGGPNPSGQNPPLYYLYADVGYLADIGGNGDGRLQTMRLWGLPLLLLSVLGAWLLVGEAVGRRRTAQLAGAAVVGLLPMVSFLSTSVTTDGLLITTWTWALWLGARVVNRQARPTDVAALFAVTAAAILTKATSYALLPGVALALVGGCRQRPAGERLRTARHSAPLLLVLAVPILGWIVLTRALNRVAINQVGTAGAAAFSVPNFIEYVWEYYLPRLPFMKQIPLDAGTKPFYTVWLAEGTGRFGWLDVPMPGWVYTAATVVWAGVSGAVLVLLARLRGAARWWLLGFFALVLVSLLGLLHITEYRNLLSNGQPFLQGRYLLPGVGLLGLGFALVVDHCPRWLRGAAAGLTLVGFLVLQVVALTTVLVAYYV